MGQNQLADEGSVIGYQPNLEYVKARNIGTETAEEIQNLGQNTGILDNLGQNTPTCQYFAQYTPSSTIGVLNTVSKELRTLIDNLSQAFADGKWNQYGNIESLLTAIEYGNDEYIQKFVDFHKYNITGSLVPELIYAIYDTNKRIELVAKTLQRMYYNTSDMTEEQMGEIDTVHVKKIAGYENNGQFYKINYVAVSSDALFNKSTSSYAYTVNAACSDLAEIIQAATHDDYSNASKLNTVKKLFLDVNNELDYRVSAYQQYQTVEILEKTLYNYYYKRQELFDLYGLITGGGSVFLGNEIIKKQSELEQAIQNCNRAYVGNSSHIQELKKLEEEKYYLLNIYGQLSTIS